jgi:hypothetical protein
MPRMMRRMARTAVVVGTATATANAVNRHQASKNAEASGDEQQYAPEPEPAPTPSVMAPVAGAPEEDMYSQLERIGALKAQGILTEEEFATQKAKILAAG